MRHVLLLPILCLLATGCATRTGSETSTSTADITPDKADILIRNARLVDGTGNPWYYADVAVKAGKITAVGRDLPLEAAQVIDAQSRVLCPGFIDVHAHAEDVYEESSERFLRMGVTTLITGNCGSSGTAVDTFLHKAATHPIPVNIATLIGHNSVRRKVMGEVDRQPTPAELAQMEALVEKAMQDGAVGLSTGLIYIPGTYADTDEVLALAKAAAKHGGIYASHIRNEGLKVQDAIREAIHIGEQAKMPVEISHFKVASKKLWGSSEQNLQLVEEARRKGIQVTIDQYAYTASSTRLYTTIPSWALAGGREEAARRMSQPDTLRKIVADMKNTVSSSGRGDYSYAVVANYRPDSTFNGKSIVQLAKQVLGKDDLDSQIRQILDMYLAGDAQMVFHSMSEQDVEQIMRAPYAMIASDAGPGTFGAGVPHPRGYGNNARVLARYVREKKIIPLEDAIRKMTSLPAQTFNLTDRGLVRAGYVADLLLLDEHLVTDRATFEKPHQYATGIDYVLVNGQLVIAEGQGTEAKPGQAVYRGQQKPGAGTATKGGSGQLE